MDQLKGDIELLQKELELYSLVQPFLQNFGLKQVMMVMGEKENFSWIPYFGSRVFVQPQQPAGRRQKG